MNIISDKEIGERRKIEKISAGKVDEGIETAGGIKILVE